MLNNLLNFLLFALAVGFIIWLADTSTNIAGSMPYATAYNNVGRLAQ